MPVSKSIKSTKGTKTSRVKAAATKTTVHHKKHVTHDAPLLESLAKPIIIKPYHHKPFRVRHVGLLLLMLVALFVATLETGLYLGKSQIASTTPEDQVRQVDTQASITSVRSAYGFAFVYDNDQFEATASAVGDGGATSAVEREQLRDNKNLNLVTLKPKNGAVPTHELATRFVVQVNPDDTAVAKLKSQAGNESLSDGEIAAKLLPLSPAPEFDIAVNGTSNETLSGVAVRKTIYQYTPKFNGSPSYAIAWTGVVNGHAFVLRLQGLVGSSAVPATYQGIFDTLNLSAVQKVAGVSTFFNAKAYAASSKPLDSKYVADSVSPSVVKIYTLYCGVLQYGGKPLTPQSCDGGTGSGFILSSDGYIGTNGHVVVFTPEDVFVKLLISKPGLLESFLKQVFGMNDAQIGQLAKRPDLLASVIGKIYDDPQDLITFGNYKSTVLVALGQDPVPLESMQDLTKALDRGDDANIKKAEVVGTNFAAKDSISAALGQGFSSSDVAILKVNVANAPALPTSTEVQQNAKITVVGFPGDAENELVAHDKLSVSITNGAISSIREAAGGTGKLYQSDADASHGNSGGPAINDEGRVIGLLTYRVGDGADGNAAKSYIRDIADLLKLAADKKVNINTTSSTQTAWLKGLELVSTNHYSKALKQFEKVKADYPSHRLVGSYIASSKKAIADGKDVKDFPIAILIGAIVVSLAGVGVAVFIIARHHGKHQVYKLAGQTSATAGAPVGFPAQPMQASATPQVAQAMVAQPQPVMPQAPVQPQSFAPQQMPAAAPAPVTVQPAAPQTVTPTQPTVVQPSGDNPPTQLVQ